MKIYSKLYLRAKAFRKASYSKAYSIEISHSSLPNDIDPDKASYNTLRALCISSCYTSVYKRKNAFLSPETTKLWDTIGRLLLKPNSIYLNETGEEPLKQKDIELRYLFLSTINFANKSWEVVQRDGPPISDWGFFTSDPGMPVRNINPAYFFVFPLLEVVAKRALSEYFDEVGKAKTAFDKFKAGDYCSDVSKVLDLLVKHPDKADLALDLEKIYSHINFLFNRPASEVIYKEWRNPAVHGGLNDPSAYIILLNIILLIAMDSCKGRLIEKVG